MDANAMTILVAAGPLSVVAAAAWRLSATLKDIQHKVARLESENRHLRSSLSSLERLLQLFVDRRP